MGSSAKQAESPESWLELASHLSEAQIMLWKTQASQFGLNSQDQLHSLSSLLPKEQKNAETAISKEL